MVEQVSDSLAIEIAKAGGNPTVPSYGLFVVYKNRRYQLWQRDGKYIAFDVSVFAENGKLVTNAGDVYWNAIVSGVGDGLQTSWDILKPVLISIAVILGIIAFLKIRSDLKA